MHTYIGVAPLRGRISRPASPLPMISRRDLESEETVIWPNLATTVSTLPRRRLPFIQLVSTSRAVTILVTLGWPYHIHDVVTLLGTGHC